MQSNTYKLVLNRIFSTVLHSICRRMTLSESHQSNTTDFQIFVVPDLLYRQTLTINNSAVDVEIVDVCRRELSLFPEEAVYWADGCVVVYDITSRASFALATELLQKVQQLRSQMPTVLLGNKSDLEHLRQVGTYTIIFKQEELRILQKLTYRNKKYVHI